MEIILERIEKNDHYTVGQLSIIKHNSDENSGREDKEYLCDTLEPKIKDFDISARHVMERACGSPGRSLSRCHHLLQASGPLVASTALGEEIQGCAYLHR